ncbi:hypothetical protein Scep_019823 [Stephania cephalantha]|uniref:Uncharacterized protein n=1 Tax=Stephania cephalantha TaxID=152367 RepID=A0AAP0IBJ4_9MAGN
MEQRLTVMAETYQKAIHVMRSTKDQRLADMTQSQERNMTRILESMQQGNTGAAERAPERHGPNPPLTPIHEDHLVEEGVDFATVAVAAAVPVVNRDPEACRRGKILKEFMKYDVSHFYGEHDPIEARHGY